MRDTVSSNALESERRNAHSASSICSGVQDMYRRFDARAGTWVKASGWRVIGKRSFCSKGGLWFLAYRYTRWKGVVSGKIAFGIHSSFHFKRKHVLLGHDVGSWISNSFFIMLSYSYSRKQD